MVFYGRKKRTLRYKKKPTVKKVVKKAIVKAKHQAFARAVKKVVLKVAETKHCQPLSSTGFVIKAYQSLGVPPQSTTIDIKSILDGIAQGTGEGDRIGNRIRVTSFLFKGFVSFMQDGNKPLFLKMIIYRNKNDAANPDMSRFLSYGNVDSPPNNNLTDIIRRINTDYYTVYASRMFKLGNSTFATGGTATGLENNDFKMTQFFNINLTKYMRDPIYNDTLSTVTNKAMYVSFLVGYFDGSTVTAAQSVATMSYDVMVSYKDM